MSVRLIVRPEAEGDILSAALWYEGRELGLGLELTGEIHAAVERALENPLAYLLLRQQPHVRRILARRFPYRIFYVVRPDAMIVFAVLHAAQDEWHWLERL
jgi:plasmid stabilization system protein ParE